MVACDLRKEVTKDVFQSGNDQIHGGFHDLLRIRNQPFVGDSWSGLSCYRDCEIWKKYFSEACEEV